MRHAEVRWLLERLPENSAVAVYQHRPRRRWEDLFSDLAARLDNALQVQAVYEANLAILVLSRARGTAERLARAAISYSDKTHGVRSARLRSGAHAPWEGEPSETMPD